MSRNAQMKDHACQNEVGTTVWTTSPVHTPDSISYTESACLLGCLPQYTLPDAPGSATAACTTNAAKVKVL
jgi:hypothetical protein